MQRAREVYTIPHECDGTTSHPLYSPLTKAEIACLCTRAQAARADPDPRISTQLVANIQIRLAQGIPGYTCGSDDPEEVQARQRLLDEYYVKNIQFYGSDHAFVDHIYEILYGERVGY